jgi:hypothetical protein
MKILLRLFLVFQNVTGDDWKIKQKCSEMAEKCNSLSLSLSLSLSQRLPYSSPINNLHGNSQLHDMTVIHKCSIVCPIFNVDFNIDEY